MSEFFERHLHGISEKMSPQNGIDGKYDIFIFAVGWEDRCERIIDYDSSNFVIHYGLILKYISEKKNKRIEEHEKNIKIFLNKKGVISDSFGLKIPKKPIKDKDQNQKRFDGVQNLKDGELKEIKDILEFIKKKYDDLKRPLVIGFDISSCSRFVFLQILNYCIKKDITSEITFFYSEGKYENLEENDHKFTEGKWETAIIPGYGTKSGDMNKKNCFIISFGFDWRHYIGLVEKHEPDHISLLLPQPGYNLEYTKRNEDFLKLFKEKLRISNDFCDKTTSEAGDAIDAWKNLDLLIKSKKNTNIITCLPYGPKPHALAMGLKAILNPNLDILYRVPSEKYNEINTKPEGYFWKYSIYNLLYY